MSKITIFGGNGFLGKRICQKGIELGYSVVSVSRSGAPPSRTDPGDSSWIDKVNWAKGDIELESSYQNAVADSDVVVHSIGLLLENSRYKLALGDNKSATLTYDKINHQSAVQLAQSLVGSPRFVYISADAGFWPVIPAGYINSKRAAEYDLTGMAKLRTLILRPGFMYDETDRGGVRYGVLSVVEGLRSIPGVGYLLRPTISTQQVASGLYKSLERYPSDKIVSLEELKNI